MTRQDFRLKAELQPRGIRMPQVPFSELEPTARSHFKLCFYGAVLNLIERLLQTFGSFEEVFAKFPFLVGYNDELAEHGLNGVAINQCSRWWSEALESWEGAAVELLPVSRLRKAGRLDRETIHALMCVGLVEEDSRFGTLFEVMQEQPGQRRPTFGLMAQWWGYQPVRTLIEFGLLRSSDADVPGADLTLHVPAPIWESIRGYTGNQIGNWARVRYKPDLLSFDELILSDDVQARVMMLPELIRSGETDGIIVRGPARNGRRTVIGAVGRELGLNILEIVAARADDQRWKMAGALAILLGAMPLILVEAAPGEVVEISSLGGYDGPIGIVLGKHGGVGGQLVDSAVAVTIDTPGIQERRKLWRVSLAAAGGVYDDDEIETTSDRYRMTAGNIRRAARLAISNAALQGDDSVMLHAVRSASRALNRQALDTRAVFVEATGNWSQLAVNAQTLDELYMLEARCRNRESLSDAVGPALNGQLNPGVRALFSGPSGTGKTLAGKLLASALQKDLYRVDLATVVNKYIGETEKNLNQVFARAEELDVILLLDEGDSLLAGRTNVHSSNDRYANLETNYLLQRVESYEGILIVTTNAGERIDCAFQRRLDVVVEFRPPEAAERHAIWQMHLPEENAVDPDLLAEVAGRCALCGGQIRNAALHASLLALEDGGIVSSWALEAAVQREYRKMGAVCPLRSFSAARAFRG